MCVCVSVCAPNHSRYPQDPEEVVGSPEVEGMGSGVSYTTWLLETRLRSSGRAKQTQTCSISPAPT